MAQEHAGKEFKALRDAAGLTQAQIAQYCGVSVVTVSRVERGAVVQPRQWVRRAQGYMRSRAEAEGARS